MMVKLREDQWQKLLAFFRTHQRVYEGDEEALRRFVEAVLWIARSGSQWRLLPPAYGQWNSIYKRFARWCEHGIWEALHRHFATDPDMEHLIFDSTVIRAHPCAAGAPHQKGGQEAQALGRSRGGFSSKIHLTVDGLGNPLDFRLTGGERHDSTQAAALLADHQPKVVIADKAYDVDKFLELVDERGAISVIPSRANRREQRDVDLHLYEERHLVECFIKKIKHFRRIFSRFEKLVSRYLSFLCFVSALIWLR